MKSLLAIISLLLPFAGQAMDKPNILWISAEDHGPHLGCYGDEYATTPNLDAFARESLRFTRASSNAPVCAPARTTIISGMYPPSTGSQHMRSRVPAPSYMKFFPAYLQEAGYYTTNNSKEDYNLTGAEKGWDESSNKAHWRNRPEEKPFFAVFNITVTHESRIRNKNPNPVHDPSKAPVPPYHPDTPEVRKDWAQYYDRLTEADTIFAGHLEELREAGLAEDTIVFYWADHGSGMPRSKRYPGWSGLHVPVMVHFPEKWIHLAPAEYAPGGSSDRLIAFIDFAPTLLSLAGVPIPDYYQGHAFAGLQQTQAPAYSFGFRGRMDERPDFCRSVTDGRYIYIRNYYPHLPHGQFVQYQQQTPTTSQWYRLFQEDKLNDVQSSFWMPHPREELYDLKLDYHSTNNLAGSPEHREAKERLSDALDQHIIRTGDLGFLPEPALRLSIKAGLSPAEAMRGTLGDMPELALKVLRERKSAEEFSSSLRDAYPLNRYWSAIQLLSSEDDWDAGTHEVILLDLLGDPEPVVCVAAAECLATRSDKEHFRQLAVSRLIDLARYPENDLLLTIHALNALDHLRESGISIPTEIQTMAQEDESVERPFTSYRPNLLKRF